MNQVEIIDIRDETELRASWLDFIRFDHYEVHSSFYESWTAKHPRRTDGQYEPLIGYIPLEQGQAVVDLVGHRLVKATRVDLK